MDAKGERLRNEIISELKAVTKALENSSTTLRTQKGVGCEFCADKLDEIADRYNDVISKLKRLT